jgi:hypothetical protein
MLALVNLQTRASRPGSLRTTSYARPGKRFTTNRELMVPQVGSLKTLWLERIVEAVIDLLRAGILDRGR